MSEQARDLRAVGERIEELLGRIRAAGDPATAETAEEVVRLVVELYGAGLERTVLAWADESATLARYVAYDLPPRDAQGPPPLSEAYRAQGERIARQRLALAGYRLAALIEARLGAR